MHLEQNRQKKAATYNAKYDGTDAFSEHAFSGFSVFVTCSCSVASALFGGFSLWLRSFVLLLCGGAAKLWQEHLFMRSNESTG